MKDDCQSITKAVEYSDEYEAGGFSGGDGCVRAADDEREGGDGGEQPEYCDGVSVHQCAER